MNDLSMWGMFLGAGIGTFLLRLSFVEIHGRWRIPALLNRALPYVPASVLSALVLPAVVYPAGPGEWVANNPQLPAACLAALVAWATKSTVLTLALGMAALWAFKFLLS